MSTPIRRRAEQPHRRDTRVPGAVAPDLAGRRDCRARAGDFRIKRAARRWRDGRGAGWMATWPAVV